MPAKWGEAVKIRVEALPGLPMAERPVEIVERKGKGHPDTLCDAMLEAVAVALGQAYLREFGTVLHFNVDKGLLAAGRVEKWFGGGRVLEPMQLFIGDRATMAAGGRVLPVGDIAVEAAKKWISTNLRLVDPERDVRFRVVLAPGSAELAGLFARPGEILGANDTSAAVGYWPLTPTEQVVLDLEHYLNGEQFKGRFPETGEDVKIMALRIGRDLEITAAMPLLAGSIASEADYFGRKEAVRRAVLDFLGKRRDFDRIALHLNALDQPGRGLEGVYLSLLGTSAEDADSGQVGRGNRVNGLIPVCRPVGAEAVAGKNPVSHVGKIFNVLAHRLARRIFEGIEGLAEVQVFLVSRIGLPIDRPQLVYLQLLLPPGRGIEEVGLRAEEIVGEALAGLPSLCREMARGEHPVC